MTARADRKLALIVGGLLALLGIGMATMQVAAWTVGSVERTAHQVIPGPVRELRVDAGPGDVTVVPALGDDVTIDSRVEGSLRTPRMRTNVTGSDVSLRGGCPAINFGHCSAQIVLHVPAGTAVEVTAASGDVAASGITAPVRLETASGDVTASGLSGDAFLHTSSGDVVARGMGGSVEMESASGDVFGTGLSGNSVRAHTSSGDVALRFRAAPTYVDAETSSGDVRITVPRDGEAYRVDVDTDSGDREVGVLPDSSSKRELSARTNSGDAVVTYGG